jgi:hypothetical protein
MSLNNSLTRLTAPGSTPSTQGALSATTFTRDWSWQGSLDYDQSRLNGWGVQWQQIGTDRFQYHFGFLAPVGSIAAPDSTGPLQLFGGVMKGVGRYALSLNLQKTASTYSANFSLQVCLGREPRSGTWVSDAQSLATTGAVSALAFLDRNGTGIRDPGDPPLEGARFRVGGGEPANSLANTGVTLVTKLAPAQPVEVSLDESSLDDPAQKSQVKAWTIVPRPGKVECLEFPVEVFGQVTGTARIVRAGKRLELPGLELQLLDANGKKVQTQRTAYDGFFEFLDLPYGEYHLGVSPEERLRVRLKPLAPREIQIRGGHNFVDGADLVVEPIPQASEPSQERTEP